MMLDRLDLWKKNDTTNPHLSIQPPSRHLCHLWSLTNLDAHDNASNNNSATTRFGFLLWQQDMQTEAMKPELEEPTED